MLSGAVVACDAGEEERPETTTPADPVAAPTAPPSPWDRPVKIPEPGNSLAAAQHLGAAERARRARDPSTALRELDAAIEQDPCCIEARTMRAQMRLSPGSEQDLVGALEDSRIVRALEPGSMPARYSEGAARFHLGDSAGAEDCLRAVHADAALLPQQRAAAASLLGQLALRREEGEAALQLLNFARGVLPGNVEVIEGIARAHKILGRPQEERRALDAGLHLDPRSLRLRLVSAQWYQRQGRAEEAAAEREIHEALRALEDNNSPVRRQDHETRARQWGHLAELLDGDLPCREEQVRALVAAGDAAAVVALIPSLPPVPELGVDLVYHLATSLARCGRDEEAAAMVTQLAPRPGLGPGALPSLERELRKIKRERRKQERAGGTRQGAGADGTEEDDSEGDGE